MFEFILRSEMIPRRLPVDFSILANLRTVWGAVEQTRYYEDDTFEKQKTSSLHLILLLSNKNDLDIKHIFSPPFQKTSNVQAVLWMSTLAASPALLYSVDIKHSSLFISCSFAKYNGELLPHLTMTARQNGSLMSICKSANVSGKLETKRKEQPSAKAKGGGETLRRTEGAALRHR